MALLPRLALVAIVAIAAALRFADLSAVALNPYYDAAVRSMGTSWHALFYGAFEPGGSIATDKPPLDLWLQVASAKLLGFTPFALHLPQALASVVAVVLLYDLVRRGFGVGAALVAAAALAVLPAEVLTARSDTMDSVMAALVVLAAWLIVRAAQRGRGRELYLAGAVVGLAFEAKLFEALVPVPALALMFLLADRGPWRRRVARLAAAGAVAVAVGLAWPAMVALTPAADRPYPMGSTSGSIWQVVFSYNGVGRLADLHGDRPLTQSGAAGPTRLLGAPGSLVAVELAAAVAFGLAALALGAIDRRNRLAVAILAGLASWLVLAFVVLSAMATFRFRYLEALTPAVAGVLGIGGAACARTVAVRTAPWRPARVAAVAVLAATLALPAARSIALVRDHQADGGVFGRMPAREAAALSRYLTANRDGARYEFAALAAYRAGPLIAADAQPVLVLASSPYRPLVSVSGLARAVADHEVRYVLVGGRGECPAATARGTTWQQRMLAWIHQHGTDVTRRAGVRRCGVLFEVGSR